MAKEATFIQDGKRIDYLAVTNIAVGQIVPMVTMVGVALTDIPTGKTGTLETTGVWEMAAETGVAFAIGEQLYWDDVSNRLTKTSTSNTPAGKCVETKAVGGTIAKVKIG